MLISFLLIDKVILWDFLKGDIFLIKYFFEELSIRIILRFFSFFAFVIKIFSDLEETLRYSFFLLLLYLEINISAFSLAILFLVWKFSRCVDCIFVINTSDGLTKLLRNFISPKLFVPISKIA